VSSFRPATAAEPRLPTSELVIGVLLNGLVAPGAGHMFTGHERRALAILALFFGAAVCGAVLLHAPSGTAWTLILGVLLISAIRIGAAFDLWQLARRQAARRRRRLAMRVMLTGGCLAVVLAITLAITAASRSWWGRPFRVPTTAMEPTLLVGDHLYADERTLRGREPRRGELVVFSAPHSPDHAFIKRVVGLPGDVIELRGDVLVINGEQLPIGAAPGHQSGFETLVVPEDSYFVLGDNGPASQDSRHWGVVPRALVIGSLTHIYWSQHPETGEIRWSRIGRRLQ
jgi:signal peptidase I